MHKIAPAFVSALRRRAAMRAFRRAARAAAENRGRIAILQSCDDVYSRLLAITGPVNLQYANRHRYVYCDHVGNASRIPVTANFNRYYLIRELMSLKMFHWALWLDADAMVIDHATTLESFIRKSEEKMLILCRGKRHAINNGVFFLNLRHPMAAALIRYMIKVCELMPRENRYRQSDQLYMNRWLLQHRKRKGSIPWLVRYTGDEATFNYDGDFIRHVPRGAGTVDDRIKELSHLSLQVPPVGFNAPVGGGSSSAS